jgi:hypothetical protein
MLIPALPVSKRVHTRVVVDAPAARVAKDAASRREWLSENVSHVRTAALWQVGRHYTNSSFWRRGREGSRLVTARVTAARSRGRARSLRKLLGAWVTRDLGARGGGRRHGDIALVLLEIFAAADEFDHDGETAPGDGDGSGVAAGGGGDGGLSYTAFRKRLAKHDIVLSDDDFATLTRFVDRNHDGMIQHSEFTAHFRH